MAVSIKHKTKPTETNKVDDDSYMEDHDFTGAWEYNQLDPEPISESVGSDDAGKIVKTDADGKIDSSLIPSDLLKKQPTLVFSDYFDGPSLDTSKWDLDSGTATITSGILAVKTNGHGIFRSKETFDRPLQVRFNFKHPENTARIGMLNSTTLSYRESIFVNYGNENMWIYQNNSSGESYVSGGYGATAQKYHTIDIILLENLSLHFLDGVYKGSVFVRKCPGPFKFGIYQLNTTTYLDFVEIYEIGDLLLEPI